MSQRKNSTGTVLRVGKQEKKARNKNYFVGLKAAEETSWVKKLGVKGKK